MNTDKKPVIGLICVVLSCVLIIGITIGILSSANNHTAARSTADTADTTTDKKIDDTDAPEEPPIEEQEPKPELEWGFSGTYGEGKDRLSGCIAYRSDTSIFDVDDVKLTIYYGSGFTGSADFYREHAMDVPQFEIMCVNNGGGKFLIREVNENFISEKYRITKIYNENHRVTDIIFNHSEEIVIPKEVFTGDNGRIRLRIWGMNLHGNVNEVLAYADIYYEMIGSSNVQLSPTY